MSSLRVFVFSAGFGLPTTGPFALKLEAWLRFNGIPYERVYEDNTRKAPKGKNPWVELDGELIGDTELIIARLAELHGVDLDGRLAPEQRATGHAVTRMVEEHLHQILEWELFVHPAGWEMMSANIDALAPWGARAVAKKYLRGHFSKQLYARGIARHTDAEIARKGRADLDALEALLPERGYLFGALPCTADASVFGLTAPLVFAPAAAPMMEYSKSLPRLSAYCRRILAEHFESSAHSLAA